MSEIEDSGKRREFATGAVRDVTADKGWYAGFSPIALQRGAVVLQKGAAKYEPRNWEKGIPLNASFDSAIRHLFQWANGETNEDHLGHAFINVMFLIHTEAKIREGKLPQELADMGPLVCGPMKLVEVPITCVDDLLKLQGVKK